VPVPVVVVRAVVVHAVGTHAFEARVVADATAAPRGARRRSMSAAKKRGMGQV
jgi:hypothetical protein